MAPEGKQQQTSTREVFWSLPEFMEHTNSEIYYLKQVEQNLSEKG